MPRATLQLALKISRPEERSACAAWWNFWPQETKDKYIEERWPSYVNKMIDVEISPEL
jgi:hypothetical protein